MNRRLAAILSADIVGYSALMGADHEGTLAGLRQFRAEVLGPAVAGHRGKVVKSMGDGWLVEFASAVEAVSCAMQVQDRLAGHQTIRLRIGVHIGDVVHEDEDVFGDGVNVAARLEALSEPGAVAVSDAVHGALDGTLRPSFDDQGEQWLKNIDRPIRVWARGGAVARAGASQTGSMPRLAILPIETSDPREEVRELAAGLTGDLTGYLDAPDWLDAVTKGDPVPGAFVLQASLRARGERLRLDARLSSPDGATLWLGKYDGSLADSFDWQDETAEDAAAETLGRIFDHEQQRLARKSIDEMTAEECHLNGQLSMALVDRASMREALNNQAAAIGKRPGYVRALCDAIANYHASKTMGLTDITEDFADDFQQWLAAAEPMTGAEPVLELYVALAKRSPEGDQTRLRRAVQGALRHAPFLPDVVLFCGAAHVWMGDPEPGLECLRAGRKLHRLSPWAAAQMGFMALALVMAGRDDEAVAMAEEGLRLTGGFATLQRALASAHANAGRMEEARAALAQVMELVPSESIAFGRRRSGYSDTPGTRRYFEGLRLAGMPEGEA